MNIQIFITIHTSLEYSKNYVETNKYFKDLHTLLSR